MGTPFLLIIVAAIVVLFLMFSMVFFVLIAQETEDDKKSPGGGVCNQSGEVFIPDIMNVMEENGGVLEPEADSFLRVANENGIDPILMIAISLQETGGGTSDALKNKNNPGGLMKAEGGLMSFGTLEEGIESMGNTLHNRIIEDGLVTIEGLGSVYAPVGAENDPNGLNEHWVPSVKEFVSDLGGLTMNCDKKSTEVIGDKAWVLPYSKNLTSVFEMRWGRQHKGIDIAGGGVKGQSIAAFQDGKVIVSELSGTVGGGLDNGKGYGYQVVIDHGDGVRTRYGHMMELGVPVGTEVKAGEEIGFVGSTGNSSGPHLHFEILIDSEAVDPLPLLEEFDLIIP